MSNLETEMFSKFYIPVFLEEHSRNATHFLLLFDEDLKVLVNNCHSKKNTGSGADCTLKSQLVKIHITPKKHSGKIKTKCPWNQNKKALYHLALR